MVKNALKTPHLPSEDEYMVIGDIHGCIDELQQLLIQNGFQINHQGLIETTPLTDNRSIILLGDFIDKASSSKLTETIEFIYHNYFHLNQKRQQFYLIMGNHEQMVYRYITNDTTLEVTPKRLSDKEKYYNTVALLETNSVLKAKFLELYEECFTWLKYSHSEAFSVTLTHAPCPVEHLGKEDETSVNKMIKCTSRSKNPDMRLDDLIEYVHKEAEDNRHYHIFGHLSQPNIRAYKNRICIDTSSIYGDTLSCAIIKKDKLIFDSTPFQHKQPPATQHYNLLFDFYH